MNIGLQECAPAVVIALTLVDIVLVPLECKSRFSARSAYVQTVECVCVASIMVWWL